MPIIDKLTEDFLHETHRERDTLALLNLIIDILAGLPTPNTQAPAPALSFEDEGEVGVAG